MTCVKKLEQGTTNSSWLKNYVKKIYSIKSSVFLIIHLRDKEDLGKEIYILARL